MGCGLSRFDPRHHHHHNHGLHSRSPSTECIGDNDHSDINITKSGSRFLFFAYHGEDDGRRSVSSPLPPIHLKHIPQMESPVMTQGNVGRRKAETCCDIASDRNPDLERKSGTKFPINNHGEEEDDDDPILSTCNLEDHNCNGGASPLFMGSPSFRVYCIVSADDDNLNSSSNINDIGNNNMSREGEARMRREDDVRAFDEGSAGSSRSSIAGVKKTRGARKLRKSASPNHRAGGVRRSLMNVASCYHPPNHHHNTLPSPPTNTQCISKLPQH